MSLAEFDRLPDRDLWIADWQERRTECPECGRPVSECGDPARKFYPFRRICYATMEREAAQEAYAALHGEDAAYHDGTFANWSKTRTNSVGEVTHPYGFGSGVSIGVADVDVTPWDTFTTDRDASPERPASGAGEAAGDEDDQSDDGDGAEQ